MTALRFASRARTAERSREPERLDVARSGNFALLLVLTTVLVVIGLVMVLSASSVEALSRYGSSWYFFERQLLWVALGALVMALTLRVDYHRWRRWARPGLLGCLALLVAVLVPGVGVTVGGSSRWLGFGSIRVQPSEITKLALVLFLADVLAHRIDHDGHPRRGLRGVVVAFLLIAVLVIKQPDLGTTMVLAAIVLGVLFAAGMPGKTMAKLAGLGLVATYLVGVAQPYRKTRLLSFLHPFADKSGAGYQLIQSLVGLGSGKLTGVGLGASRAKWGFLPNAHTDFIFAIIGEELGLIGSVLVIGLFLAFAVVGIRAARRAPDRFGALLAVGVTIWITAQAVLNIGAVIGVVPVTGVPLPLVSFGGTSLVIVMGAIGILLNVASKERRIAAVRP